MLTFRLMILNKELCIGLFCFSIFFLSNCSSQQAFEDDLKLCDLLAKMTTDDQKYRHSQESYENNLQAQTALDHENCNLLLAIIKKRGWPSKNKIGCEQEMMPVVIFRHAPKELWPEIEQVIEIEYGAKRMTEGDYKFILNHITGRPMNLEIDGVDIKFH